MIPTAFDEENALLQPPPQLTVDQCEPLSICLAHNDEGQPVIISAFKPTVEELAEIQRTGRVWLMVYGWQMPPVKLSGYSPFGRRMEQVNKQ